MKALEIARVCHEANRAYCFTHGDVSQPSWDEAPDWQKDSALHGVQAILADPGTTPEQSHQNWTSEKEAAGWKYGPLKDPEKKEHPCMVPYSRLPEHQKRKDALFGAIVRSLA